MSNKDATVDDAVVVRPFADWLREQAKGVSHEELSESLHKLVEAVVETGKKGTLTFKITVDHVKNAEAHVLKVTDQIALSAPTHDRPVSVFFSNEGNLQRKDPTSPELGLGLRDVSIEPDDQLASKEKRA
jgi:hypothetical protein